MLIIDIIFPWFITVTNTCKGTAHERKQIITSPNYPEKYPANTDCYWTIIAPMGMRLKIDSFSYQIEEYPLCHMDYLGIYEGANENNRIGERICGQPGKQPSVVSQGNTLTLKFHSDPGTYKAGFKIRYNAIGK